MNTVYNSFRKIETIEGFVKPYYNCYNRAEFSYAYDESRTLVTFQSKATSDDPYIETHKKYYLSNYEYYVKANQDTKEVTYISTRNGVVAAIINETNQPERTVYVHKDYLGSIQSLSEVNSQGNVVIVAEFSFDAWGRARSHTDWDVPYQSDASVPGFALLERGFTGHEHIIQFGIINMNARLYDPIIASFLSPDDVVSDPENPQNYNRFSYALNNPMRYTDPSGNDPMFAAMFIRFMETTSNHGIGQGMLSLGASAVSYGIGTFVNMGFNSIFSNNSALASFSISIAAAITTDAITGLIFEGKYTGASALYSVFSSAKGWVMNYLEYSSQSMNEVSENTTNQGPTVDRNIREIYDKFYESTTSEIREQLDGMNPEYYIGFSNEVSGDGLTIYNYDENRLEMLINPNAESVIGTIGDEVQTGIQFKTGKLIYFQKNGQTSYLPIGDSAENLEIETKFANKNAVDNYNNHFRTNLQYSRSIKDFILAYENHTLAEYWHFMGYKFPSNPPEGIKNYLIQNHNGRIGR